MFINVNGTWKNITGMFVNVSGTWKRISDGFLNVAGTWKTFFSSALSIAQQVTISKSTNGTTFLTTLTGTNYYWSPGPPVLTYKFQRSVDSGVTWSDLDSGSIVNPTFGSSNTKTYSLASSGPTLGVLPNVLNYYRFRVDATYGSLSSSSISSSTTIQGPTNTTISLSDPTFDSIALTWTASTGANRYLVYKSTDNITFSQYTSVTSTTLFGINGLVGGSTHYFYVVPITGGSFTYPGYLGNNSNTLVLPILATPTLSAATSNSSGFSFTINNYDASNTYVLSITSGSISRSGSLVTVSGLSSGSSATATVRATRSGYGNSNSATRIGTALAQYTVTWNANGGSVSPSSNTVNAGASVTPPTPTRSGYTFNYWRNPLSGGDPIIIYAGVPYTPTGNITFYAIWTLNVSIPSGGSVSLTGGSTAGSVITASTSGWSGSPTSYNVYITTALSPNIPTSSSTGVADSGGGSSTTYTITSFDTVSPVNIFRAFATASNSAGTSGVVQSSNTITAQSSAPATAPGTPGTPTNGWIGGTAYPFSWTAPGPGTEAGGVTATITNYLVRIYEATNSAGTGATLIQQGPTGSGSSSYAYTSPNAALYYAASVSAINSAGLQGPYSGISQYK